MSRLLSPFLSILFKLNLVHTLSSAFCWTLIAYTRPSHLGLLMSSLFHYQIHRLHACQKYHQTSGRKKHVVFSINNFEQNLDFVTSFSKQLAGEHLKWLQEHSVELPLQPSHDIKHVAHFHCLHFLNSSLKRFSTLKW